MKFNYGKIPENPYFTPNQQGWKALKEPSPLMAQLIGLPVGILAVVLLYVLWSAFTPTSKGTFPEGIFIIFIVVGIFIVHEIVHSLFHPHYGVSSKSIIGFWPSKMIFYAHYDGILSKWHFIRILIGPFVIISILPLIVSAILQYSSSIVFIISLFNGFLSYIDLLGAVLIGWQVPSAAYTCNKGWNTYYSLAEHGNQPDVE